MPLSNQPESTAEQAESTLARVEDERFETVVARPPGGHAAGRFDGLLQAYTLAMAQLEESRDQWKARAEELQEALARVEGAREATIQALIEVVREWQIASKAFTDLPLDKSDDSTFTAVTGLCQIAADRVRNFDLSALLAAQAQETTPRVLPDGGEVWKCRHCGYMENVVGGDWERAEPRRVAHEAQCPSNPSGPGHPLHGHIRAIPEAQETTTEDRGSTR